MSAWKLATPVAFIIFNRPDTTQAVFERIREARPPRLLVIADGPRANRPQEPERCAAARAIVDAVDWPCEVETNFSASNLGCRDRVASGIDWVFSHVPEAILLEDDCLPDPSFFRFCQELLEHYRDDERVGMISGTNLQGGRRRGDASYYFSKYSWIWGWASWRRAWAAYDRSAACWPEFLASGALDGIVERAELNHWVSAFAGVHSKRIDTWDYQWTLANWCQNRLAIVPDRNLISNIGFGPDATHTVWERPYAKLATQRMPFPLSHPRFLLANREADAHMAAVEFNERLRSRMKRYLTLARW